MKRAYVPYLLLWLLVVAIFAAQGIASAKGPPAIKGTFTLTTTTGSAFKINDTSVIKSASVNIQGTYEGVGKDTKIVKLTIASGSVSVDGVTHSLIDGRGIYSPRTGKIIITARVDVQPGERGRTLVLYGTVSALATQGYSNSIVGGDVTFRKPQSKLSGAYFLAISGNLVLTPGP